MKTRIIVHASFEVTRTCTVVLSLLPDPLICLLDMCNEQEQQEEYTSLTESQRVLQPQRQQNVRSGVDDSFNSLLSPPTFRVDIANQRHDKYSIPFVI